LDHVFLLLSLAGLVSFCLLLTKRYRAWNGRNKWQTRLFQQERLHRLLADAGLHWKASHVQAILFGAAAIFLLYAYGSALWRQEELSLMPVAVMTAWLLGTSPVRFSPLGLLVHVRRTVAAARRDGDGERLRIAQSVAGFQAATVVRIAVRAPLSRPSASSGIASPLEQVSDVLLYSTGC